MRHDAPRRESRRGEAVNFCVAEVARLPNSPRKRNSGEFRYQIFHSLGASRHKLAEKRSPSAITMYGTQQLRRHRTKKASSRSLRALEHAAGSIASSRGGKCCLTSAYRERGPQRKSVGIPSRPVGMESQPTRCTDQIEKVTSAAWSIVSLRTA